MKIIVFETLFNKLTYSQNNQRVPLMTEESISLLRNQLQSSIRISKFKRNIEIIGP